MPVVARRVVADTPARRVATCTALLAVGLAEAALALDWGHSFGVGVGVAAVACGACLALPLAYTSLPPPLALRVERALTAWGLEAPMQSLGETRPPPLRVRRWHRIATALLTASALLLAVRLLSADPAQLQSFPAACPAQLPDGCVRAASRAPHGFAPPLQPLVLRAKPSVVKAAARGWAASADAPTRGQLLADSLPPSLLHFRFVSRLWGFADDTYLALSACGAGTRVQAHSQLRLGKGDLGVNAARVKALWQHLESAFDGADDSACQD